MKATLTAVSALLTQGVAFPHDGHGLFASHWHATDTLGLLVAGGGVLAVWFSRGGK